jgi:hypothetical protein
MMLAERAGMSIRWAAASRRRVLSSSESDSFFGALGQSLSR